MYLEVNDFFRFGFELFLDGVFCWWRGFFSRFCGVLFCFSGLPSSCYPDGARQ